MASSMFRMAGRSAAPAAAYLLSSSSLNENNKMNDQNKTFCEAASPAVQKQLSSQQPITATAAGGNDVKTAVTTAPQPQKEGTESVASGMTTKQGGDADDEYFHGLFPKRQLWKPRLAYPLWDYDWDERKEKGGGNEVADRERERFVRKNGVTRHIILIRHGQYDETHKEDEKRILTGLGRKQAELTGQRLAEMIKGIDEKFGPCNVKVLRVSDMARAKETADIIAKHLPHVERSDPDPLLNEGRPAHHIPGGKARQSIIDKTDENHPRIEKAFRKYFYRADPPPSPEEEQQSTTTPDTEQSLEREKTGDPTLQPHPKHEFEVIVCHANVIRYFLCRALQLPPEAWLRLCIFNCSLNYVTIRPTGTVSCRFLGDIGHLGHEHSTFSMHHGFNW